MGDPVRGDAVRIEGNSQYVQLRNNILWVEEGYDISVANDSQVGFQSDYNLLYTTGSGKLGLWEGQDFTTQVDWFYELGFDGHSQTTDPLFVGRDGVDGILGFNEVDHGQDDDFHLVLNSPAIDAGDPGTHYLAELAPNGGRVNQGAYGNTPAATTSRAELVQVLSPNRLEKLVVGQPVSIDWLSAGLTLDHTVALINAGGVQVENWPANAFQIEGSSDSFSNSVDLSAVTDPAPAAVYQTRSTALGGIGNRLVYALPLPDGAYDLRLHFVEPSSTTTVGTRVFDIFANGVLLQKDFDILAVAGASYQATTLALNGLLASGGDGILLELVNETSSGAVLAAIEITTANPSGVANPTVDLELSTDNGGSWTTIATGLAMDRFGRGSYLWTAGPETTGNSGLVRVTANEGGNPQDTSDESFLIANAGANYYVNIAGDVDFTDNEYTTIAGDNAYSGKSPDRPMASLTALLAAYDLGPGDTIFVDSGVYSLLTNILITGEDAGVTIVGPTEEGHEALLDRGSTSTGSYVLELQSVDGVTLRHLSTAGG